MMAITICYPYPILILWPADQLRGDDVPKRTENRTWPTNHRGNLLIHAGKAKNWLRPGDLARYPEMMFGHVVGIVDMTHCIPVTWKDEAGALAALPNHLKWIATHVHASGPWLWVFERPRRFANPVPCRGQQGLWECPGDWEHRICDPPEERYEHKIRAMNLAGESWQH